MHVSLAFAETSLDDIAAGEIQKQEYDEKYNAAAAKEKTLLNPALSKIIPSMTGSEGLVAVFQVEKYSPYWMSEDGRVFEMFSPDSFKQVSQPSDRPQYSSAPQTGQHTGFGVVMYESERATDLAGVAYQSWHLRDHLSNDVSIGQKIADGLGLKASVLEHIGPRALEDSSAYLKFFKHTMAGLRRTR